MASHQLLVAAKAINELFENKDGVMFMLKRKIKMLVNELDNNVVVDIDK